MWRLSIDLQVYLTCRLEKIVSVTFTQTGMPCARRPSLFSHDLIQKAQYLGLLMRWRYSMSSPVYLLRTATRTSFEYSRRVRVRELSVCRTILKLSNIASRVLWRIDVLLLVLLSGVAFSLDSRSWGAAVSDSLITWRCMFRAAMRGERHGGAALGMSGAAVWDVGKFGEGVGGDK